MIKALFDNLDHFLLTINTRQLLREAGVATQFTAQEDVVPSLLLLDGAGRTGSDALSA